MAKKIDKLEALYNIIESSEIAGVELNQDVLTQIADREEAIIREEVLPVLRDSIEPVLRKIRRPLSLLVEYRPDEPITLRISRQQDLADLSEATPLTPDDIPDIKRRKKQQRGENKMPTQVLRVTLPDGRVFFNPKNGTDTFCKVIEHIGLTKVRNLEMLFSGVNLVSTSKDPNRQQHQSGDYYIFTNRSTSDKKKILDQVSSRLNLDMKVEVVEK